MEAITNEPDEDGFVTVTRHHKKNVNRDKASGATMVAISSGRLKTDDSNRKKKDSKERVDFYRFQMREAKREKLAELRRKFNEDKDKIAKMKESRRFKPY